MKMSQTVIYQARRLLVLTAIVSGLGGLLYQHWQQAAVSAQQAQVVVLNAASFKDDRRVAPDSLAVAFGQYVTQNNQNYSATSLPLPTTLGGVRLTINGQAAGLLFVGLQQINFLVPPNLQDAPSANVTVTNSDNSTRSGTVTIVRSAVGVFSARANGQGVAAALTTTDGVNYQAVFNPDLTERVVSAGTVQQRNFLILYVTGLRNVPAQNPSDANGVAEAVRVTLLGVPLRVDFAGPVGGLAGLEQINAALPPEAAGLGSVDIQVTTVNPPTTAPQESNKVKINMGPDSLLPQVRVTPISFGQTITGELTVDDQIQANPERTRTYFIDAYRFTTTQANATIAIDQRATGNSTLDAGVLLYQVVNNNQLIEIGSDDESGGLGNGGVDNHNALLLAVLPTAGDYVIFASSAAVQPNGTGAYSLRLSQAPIQQINYGANLNAAITNTDLQTSAGDYFDAYWFQAAANDNVDIRLNSDAFDSLLLLYQNETGGGFPIASNDNENTSTRNSRITRRLGTAGIYIIWATPFEPNRTGAYTLLLNRLAAGLTDELPGFAPGRALQQLSAEGRASLARHVTGRVIEE